MEFGAFVQLEPGIEGLVHISELAHQRVFRVTDIVKEGDAVDVKVQSVDADQQRIGLSMKALAARPGPVKKGRARARKTHRRRSSASARLRSKGAWAKAPAATRSG